MTIPDMGHCAGSGSEPAHGSIQTPAEEVSTGVCPACSGRFALHGNGVLTLHAAADIDEREVLDGPSLESETTRPVSE